MNGKKPDEAELENRRSTLRARGVPEAFVEAIATRRSSFVPYMLQDLIVILVSIGMAAAACFTGLWSLSFFTVWRARSLGLANGASLFQYHDTQGLAIVVAMIGLMVVPPWFWYRRKPRPHPAPNRAAQFLRQLTPAERRSQPVLKIDPKTVAVRTEVEFLDLFGDRPTALITWMMIVPLITAVVLFFVMADNYWVLRGDRVTMRNFGSSHTYSLRDVRNVTVACNHNGPERDVFLYRLEFAKTWVTLNEADKQYSGPVLMAQIERVDRELRARGVPHWQYHDEGAPMAPCIKVWAARMGTDEARFARLLRAP